MKRYHADIASEEPEGGFVLYSDLQARDLKLAELAKALPHEMGCPAELCSKCFEHINGHEFADFGHEFESMDCNCPRGKLLAMLGETT